MPSMLIKMNSFLSVILSIGCLTVAAQNEGDLVYSEEDCMTPNMEQGLCVKVQDCEPMVKVLRSLKYPVAQNLKDELNKYVCSSNPVIHVCCTGNPIVIQSRSSNYVQKLEPPDVSFHRNLGLLPENCGEPNLLNNKILGGIDTKLNEFPWMVLLGYRSVDGPKYRCDGTIINERYILTAAHCVKTNQGPPNTVRLGEYNLSTRKDCATLENGTVKCSLGVQNVAIEQIIAHPDFDDYSLINDIALIRMPKMNISIENVQPICLPLGDLRNAMSDNYIAVGWGLTNNETSPNIVQKVSVRMVDLETCKRHYSYQVKITEKQLCAGGNKENVCSGDSGGPIQYESTIDGTTKYIQQGVISFGTNQCGFGNKPSVHSNVAYYMNWILDTLKP
ncbi:unnamed protein product [Phyllotreta striolata]|uniref:CLIP domain-containing serine protease n=1 Tax=Phyllotreta striolata TaxID=444603 RepID=A0A9N9TKB6_PHYSR|nr:unnamed protein product [Phyllotreta striolata]